MTKGMRKEGIISARKDKKKIGWIMNGIAQHMHEYDDAMHAIFIFFFSSVTDIYIFLFLAISSHKGNGGFLALSPSAAPHRSHAKLLYFSWPQNLSHLKLKLNHQNQNDKFDDYDETHLFMQNDSIFSVSLNSYQKQFRKWLRIFKGLCKPFLKGQKKGKVTSN